MHAIANNSSQCKQRKTKRKASLCESQLNLYCEMINKVLKCMQIMSMQHWPRSSVRLKEIMHITGPDQSEAYAGREMHKISHIMCFSSHFTLIPKHNLIICVLIIFSKSIIIVNNYSKQSIRLNLRISCHSPFARKYNGEEDNRCA